MSCAFNNEQYTQYTTIIKHGYIYQVIMDGPREDKISTPMTKNQWRIKILGITTPIFTFFNNQSNSSVRRWCRKSDGNDEITFSNQHICTILFGSRTVHYTIIHYALYDAIVRTRKAFITKKLYSYTVRLTAEHGPAAVHCGLKNLKRQTKITKFFLPHFGCYYYFCNPPTKKKKTSPLGTRSSLTDIKRL